MYFMLKKLFVIIMLVSISSCAVLLVAEMALRLTPYEESLYNGISFPRYYYSYDEENGYDLSKNFSPTDFIVGTFKYKIWTNELGCFDRPYNFEKDYVILAGDSFTWGFAPFEDKWGSVIERKSMTRVLKCGVAGYGTKQVYLKIRKIASELKTPPKLIIVGYFMNDIQDDYLFPSWTVVDGYLVQKVIIKDMVSGEKRSLSDAELKLQVKNYQRFGLLDTPSRIEVIKGWLRKNSIFYHLLQDNLIFRRLLSKVNVLGIHRLAKPAEEFKWIDWAWHQNRNNLLQIKRFADEVGARLVFVIIPENYQIYDFLKTNSKNDIPQYEFLKDRLTKFFNDENINYLDLTEKFREYADNSPRKYLDSKKDLYYRYDGHWSIKGNHLAGLLVSKYLLENKIMKIVDSESKLDEINKELNGFNAINPKSKLSWVKPVGN